MRFLQIMWALLTLGYTEIVLACTALIQICLSTIKVALGITALAGIGPALVSLVISLALAGRAASWWFYYGQWPPSYTLTTFLQEWVSVFFPGFLSWLLHAAPITILNAQFAYCLLGGAILLGVIAYSLFLIALLLGRIGDVIAADMLLINETRAVARRTVRGELPTDLEPVPALPGEPTTFKF